MPLGKLLQNIWLLYFGFVRQLRWLPETWIWLFKFDFSPRPGPLEYYTILLSSQIQFFLSIFPYLPSIFTHKCHVSHSVGVFLPTRHFYSSACTHTTTEIDVKGGYTCDFKPHRNIRGFGGDNAHHVRHRVAFHDGKGKGRLLKKQGSCIGWQFWFENPLNMQTTSGGFLRTSVVDSFDLRERRRMWAVLNSVMEHVGANGWVYALNTSEATMKESVVMWLTCKCLQMKHTSIQYFIL